MLGSDVQRKQIPARVAAALPDRFGDDGAVMVAQGCGGLAEAPGGQLFPAWTWGQRLGSGDVVCVVD